MDPERFPHLDLWLCHIATRYEVQIRYKLFRPGFPWFMPMFRLSGERKWTHYREGGGMGQDMKNAALDLWLRRLDKGDFPRRELSPAAARYQQSVNMGIALRAPIK